MMVMIAKILASVCVIGLTSCIDRAQPVNLTHSSAKNRIVSKTITEHFVKGKPDNNYLSESGVGLVTFLRNSSFSNPDYVFLEASVAKSDLSTIWASIDASGILESSKVRVLQLPPEQDPGFVVKVDAVYFLYQLSDCSKITSPRKLDSTQLTSPGFGCSVERNRLLSLSNPEDWLMGRQGTRPNSAKDVKAVQDYHAQATRPFPTASD
jgi:type IV pilus biogenesis protein CpaD/CtpE